MEHGHRFSIRDIVTLRAIAEQAAIERQREVYTEKESAIRAYYTFMEHVTIQIINAMEEI